MRLVKQNYGPNRAKKNVNKILFLCNKLYERCNNDHEMFLHYMSFDIFDMRINNKKPFKLN